MKLWESYLRYLHEQNTYGGKGKFELPSSHIAAFEIPKGGSSCASCKWVSIDMKSCANPFFIEWNGGDTKLPVSADRFCSDWYQENKK